MHTDMQIGRYKDRPTDGRSDGTAGRTDGRTEKHAYRHQARGTLSIKYTVYRLHTCRPGKREREREQARKKAGKADMVTDSDVSVHAHPSICACTGSVGLPIQSNCMPQKQTSTKRRNYWSCNI